MSVLLAPATVQAIATYSYIALQAAKIVQTAVQEDRVPTLEEAEAMQALLAKASGELTQAIAEARAK